MGIKGLMKYIIKYGNYSPITERIIGDKIFTTNVVYLDGIGKMIEIYEQLRAFNENMTYEELYNYELEKFTQYLCKISYYNRVVNVFVDYHFADSLSLTNKILPEFLPKADNTFHVYKKKNKRDGNRYYLEELYKNNLDENDYEESDTLYEDVWNRYLIRVKSKENINNIRKSRIEEEIGSTYEDNAFRLLIHNFNTFSKDIKRNEALKLVNFFGCSVESDFAIANHIKTYNTNTYPIIISNDTDFLSLLCDVNCLIKFIFRRKTYYVNPPIFWKRIFDADLNPNIIKMLCVLKKTDYNLDDECITINEFEDILPLLGVERYEQISEEMLIGYIKNKLIQNPDNEKLKYTVLAINIMINITDSERFHQLA